MVKLVVYLKFVGEFDSKNLTHSGNHTYRGRSKGECLWFCDGTVEEFEGQGWELVERRVVEVSMYSGGGR